jgi:hypothetical protein
MDYYVNPIPELGGWFVQDMSEPEVVIAGPFSTEVEACRAMQQLLTTH